jgi:hypothetical protein
LQSEEATDFQEPETIWKYGEDADVEDNKSVSTWDLIRWILQIARGMEYLTSKKVRPIKLVTPAIITESCPGPSWRFGRPQRPFGRLRNRQNRRFWNVQKTVRLQLRDKRTGKNKLK